jgi:myosin-1
VRVVEQSKGERNYHIFYQLCAAAKAGKLPGAAGKAFTPDASSHVYSKTCTSVDDMDDSEEFDATVAALDALGVKGSELEAIFRAAAAVYVLGDVEFAEDGDGSKVVSQGPLDTAASLLGVSSSKLAQALCTRVRDVAGEGGVRDIVTTQNTPEEASTLRHALAKATFSRLFDWLVQRANKAFDKSDQSQFIGILDIFGFEDMATNGFEQVFINTTNEQLQKVFNDLVFEAEAEEYTREGADSASCMTLNLTSSRDRRDAVV